MADKQQAGIHFRSGEAPPPFFRLVTFNFHASATRESARRSLIAIWELLAELKSGQVRDLRATREDDPVLVVDAGRLSYLLGFGRRLFDASGRQEPIVPLGNVPDETPALPPFADAPFTSLKWSRSSEPTAAQTDFAIQLTATSELAVTRPIVEIQKLIDDMDLPLRIIRFFGGLHRDDRRSWIDFHDGINNMASAERLDAIEIRQSPQEWMLHGTTMTFLRIAVDMQGWRRLSREQQEGIVGRDKLSGCPITKISVDDNQLVLTRMSGCPFKSEIGVGNGWPDEARDPGPVVGLAGSSHIHRSNLTRQPPATEAARRVYRQGYEFVDSPIGGGVKVGLNFVGFQRDANTVLSILRNSSWLGNVNFGGVEDEAALPPFKLMSLDAGGTFAVPRLNVPFPGSSLFEQTVA